MAFLYISPNGTEWHKHSYSAGNLFDRSPLAYKLQKIDGWREKNKRARFEFGKCLEEAIQHHHEHNGEGAIERFVELWRQHADNKDLQYTKVERDWATLYKTGVDMIKLYIIRQPSLPIPLGGQTLFQREFSKEVFPGDEHYGGIDFIGKLDIVSYVDPSHPLLPKVNWKPEYGAFRPIIIDIKTSGADFPEQYGLAAYDTQLRTYSWLTGIRDVALCFFVKKGHSLQKGSSVTLLKDAGSFKAGQEAVVAAVKNDSLILVANDSLIEEMERVQGKKIDKNGKEKTDQTNEAKAHRDAWLKDFGVVVSNDSVTKQRLQFNAGFVTVDSANDAGQIAARQIVSIVNAWHSKSYPNQFSVRYPHDDLSDPYFRAFVLNDESYKQQNFTKTGDDFDDLFADYGGDADEN
jgi:hypothetical protein